MGLCKEISWWWRGNRPSCSLVLLVLSRALIFALGLVPQSQRNGQGRQSHHGEGHPVEEMGGEALVVLVQVDNSTLTGLRADRQLELQELLGIKFFDRSFNR